MPTNDGYPTDEELTGINETSFNPLNKSIDELRVMLDYLERIWWASDWGFVRRGKKVIHLELHTGGWSGNEDIIDALEKTWFWRVFWYQTRRGGHYYFKVHRIPTGEEVTNKLLKKTNEVNEND